LRRLQHPSLLEGRSSDRGRVSDCGIVLIRRAALGQMPYLKGVGLEALRGIDQIIARSIHLFKSPRSPFLR
jgi:hypothetical protein